MTCELCGGKMMFWYRAGRRTYYRCAKCGFVKWYAVR